MASSRLAPRSSSPWLPWQWQQGDHLSLIGETGTGKSTLMAALLRQWSYLIVLQTKADKLTAADYSAHLIRRARQLDDTHYSRFLLRPAYREQRREVAIALDRPWKHNEKGWTIAVDEEFYVEDNLRLGGLIERNFTQGRSHFLTNVAGMQRPSGITRFVMSQSTHVVSFGMEGRDAKVLSEATTASIQDVVDQLGRHEFVWFYRPTRSMWIGRLDLKTGRLIETARFAPERVGRGAPLPLQR